MSPIEALDLNDIRDTNIRLIGKDVYRLTNPAIALDSVVTKQELSEILSNLTEFVDEIAYTIK